ncbi:hypothetical protein LTR91_007378 [Friedmanniomyces endolithicus]|uniref:Uncharacterized protein n=1 Tax=Friedmanniomyces endolithicus TaxID=329885 RepID=A0AAN6QVZ7_9PEZI|nr:hypothetical protein LTR57_006288 [Friedmanniomyces endolithicus]KAK0995187.1 hypothetical protein LTR91_007378 [Friedmanniomyces endolithicus]KAK0995266.1 hypothetical protein LTS01_006769 [Friedmanniomyces endolithicus]
MTKTRPTTVFPGVSRWSKSLAAPTTASRTQQGSLSPDPLLMSGALPMPTESTPQSIEWSPTYDGPETPYSKLAAVHKQFRRKCTSTKRWAKRVVRKIRSVFSCGKKRSSLSSSTSHRSSTRSRRSVRRSTRISSVFVQPPTPSGVFGPQLKATDGSADTVRSSADAPNVVKTSPSGKRYSVHQHAGPSSELVHTRRSVLIAHPRVSAVIPELPTPMSTTSSAGSRDSWGVGDEKHFSSSSAGSGSDGAPSLNMTGQVNPKDMYRDSLRYSQKEGTAEDYRQFRNKIDGVKAPSRPSSETINNSTMLPFIPKTPSLTDDDSSDYESVFSTGSDTTDNRSQALQTLTSNAAASVSCPDDLHFGSSQPTIKPESLLRRPATTGGSVVYLPYSDCFAPFDPYNEQQAASPALPTTHDTPRSLSTPNTPSTPSFLADADTATHKDHYSHIESGNFDAPGISRPTTPTFFANPAAHRDHYDRVESVAFDAPPPRPANPTPDNQPPSSSTPPSLPQQTNPRTFQIKRKPLPSTYKPVVVAVAATKPAPDLNKALPDVPSDSDPKRYTHGVVPALFLPPSPAPAVAPAPAPTPARLSMVENGYPTLPRNNGKQPARDSAVSVLQGRAVYQVRTLSPAEAKAKRDEERERERERERVERAGRAERSRREEVGEVREGRIVRMTRVWARKVNCYK